MWSICTVLGIQKPPKEEFVACIVLRTADVALHTDKYFGPTGPWANCTVPKPNVDAKLIGGGKSCAPGCKAEWLGDGVCDLACNVCALPAATALVFGAMPMPTCCALGQSQHARDDWP
jgi:hypothetical protein